MQCVSIKIKENELILKIFLLCTLISLTTSETKTLVLQKTTQNLPILNINLIIRSVPQTSFLLDFGSSQLILFDNQCRNCQQTIQACSYLNMAKQISYLSMNIKGDFVVGKVGGVRTKYFCVVQKEHNNGQQFMGIVGLKQNVNGNSTGIQFWKQLTHKIIDNEIKQNQPLPQITLIYKKYQTFLHLGNLPSNLNNPILFQSFISQIHLKTISFIENSINLQNEQSIKVIFDSGSNVMVINKRIFQQVFRIVRENVDQRCIVRNGMICCGKQYVTKLIGHYFNIQIKSNNQIFTLKLPMQKLIIKQTSNQRSGEFYFCFLNQTEISLDNTIILGIPIFQQYIIQHSYHQLSSQFPSYNYLNIYSSQPLVQIQKLHETNITFSLMIYIILVSILSIGIVRGYWMIGNLINQRKL